MDIFNYKCLNKKIKKNNPNLKYIKNLSNRILITIILFLICSILIKSNNKYKEAIYKNIYNNNISFTGIKKFYDKYLGGVLPFDTPLDKTKLVFSENLTYQEESKYLDGVKLSVDNNYLVPILESGIVVFIGEKEGYGNTIIIQGMNGIDIWYSNIENESVKLYDYVEAHTLLGNAKGDYFYLTYSQNGVFLNYEEYLK